MDFGDSAFGINHRPVSAEQNPFVLPIGVQIVDKLRLPVLRRVGIDADKNILVFPRHRDYLVDPGEAGARVVATAARERDEIERLAHDANAGGWRDAIHPMLADATCEDDCVATVAAALERFGGLDILVNNAGRGMRYVSGSSDAADPLLGKTPAETWRLVIETNAVGPFLMARAAAPVGAPRIAGAASSTSP